jgi:hypothetical protein
MRLHPLSLLLTSLSVLASCVEQGGTRELLDSAPVPREGELPPSARLNRASWAVAITDGECPQFLNAAWERVGTRMFVDGTQALAATPAPELPESLSRFCLYRWAEEGEPLPPDDLGVMAVSQEAPVAVTQKKSTLTLMTRAAFEQAGGLAASGALGEHPVMVAVVDSGSSNGEPEPADHGGAMQGLVLGMACAGRPDCPAWTRRTLALPIEPDGTVDDPNGGVYGTRGHVAIGVVEAVHAWRDAVLAADPELAPRLVINLSLGWVAEDGTDCSLSQASPWCGTSTALAFQTFMEGSQGLGYQEKVAVEALHAALLYASCHGALVVAAAGNGRGDSCNEAPMAPAAWSKYRAPTLEECNELGFTPDLPVGFALAPEDPSGAAPLVLSVAAVDHDDRPIAATRPGTFSSLVAPGYHAVGWPSKTPLTGTSVSAALVSGAAALVWSHAPGLSPMHVSDALWHFGKPLPLVPQAQTYGSSPQHVRRLDACVASAWAGGVASDAQCGASDLDAILDELAYATVATSPKTAATLDPAAVYDDTCTACGAPAMGVLYPDPDPDGPYFLACTDQIDVDFPFDASADLAGPQPSTPICPDCPLVITETQTTATLKLHHDYQLSAPLEITGGTLTVFEGTLRTIYDVEAFLPIDDLRAGTPLSLRLPHHPEATSAVVSFAIAESSGDTYFRSGQLRLTR